MNFSDNFVFFGWVFLLMADRLYSDYINEIYLCFNLVETSSGKSFYYKCLFSIFWFVFSVPVLFFLSFSYAVLMLFFPRKIDRPECSKKICVARTFATKNKLSFLKEDGVAFLFEKPFAINLPCNIYNVPLRFRFFAFVNACILAFKDIFSLSRDVVSCLELKHFIKAFLMYAPRLPHKVNFEAYLEQNVLFHRPSLIITGNKEDRFALVEEGVSKSKFIELICYPHGLEYAIKLPRGVVGNKFYCYSEATRSHYTKLYKEKNQEFLFEPEVVKRLLGKNRTKNNSERRLVFFPESRDKAINYSIVKTMLSENLKFFLKLHPLDSAEQYLLLGLTSDNFINDFDEAVSGNIVLARKSTVLLEAIYSGSESCALLFDDADYHSYMKLFPSLWDERIFKFRTSSEFMHWLEVNDFKKYAT